MFRWLFAVALFLVASFAVIAQSAEKADPIVGKWIWYQGAIATFDADETGVSGGLKGKWRFLQNPEVQRKYRIIWNEGVFINSVVMSEDQQTLSIQDNNKVKFTARRATVKP